MKEYDKHRGTSMLYRLLCFAATLSLFLVTGCAITYDFADPSASALNGQTEETYTVKTVPLEIESGTMTEDGTFNLGGASSTLYTEVGEGLGVVTTGLPQGGNQLTVGEGIVFHFDSQFDAQRITLRRFGNAEDMRIFIDGFLYADFYGPEIGERVIPLPNGIITLGVTTLGSMSDDSDFFISSIEGKRKNP
jgi:hypothetical protein